MNIKKYECQGIGRGAVCGAEATEQVWAYKWNPEAAKVKYVSVRMAASRFFDEYYNRKSSKTWIEKTWIDWLNDNPSILLKDEETNLDFFNTRPIIW